MQQLYTAYLLIEWIKGRALARKKPFSETVIFINNEILYLTHLQAVSCVLYEQIEISECLQLKIAYT